MLPLAPAAFALLSERDSPRLPIPQAPYNFTSSYTNSTTPSPSNYTLVDLFNAQNFFSEFAFFNDSDPTHGFVQYVDYQTANKSGLVGYAPDGVMLGVDYINKISSNASPEAPGRPSVRVTSQKTYTEGLFVADIYHMPSGNNGKNKAQKSSSCGLWSAFWTFGPSWPSSGEIDIVEGVNTQATNSITLHASGTKNTSKKGAEGGGSCNISSTGSMSDTKLAADDCASSTGCKQDTMGGDSTGQKQQKKGTGNYGVGFNKGGGGVYAVEWSSSDGFIKVWFFPRGSELATKLAGNTTTTTAKAIASSSSAINTTAGGVASSVPGSDPSSFGTPLAAFVFDRGCSMPDHFKNHSIVFNTAFCGDWAGAVWGDDPTCKGLAKKCEDYVGANPGQFKEAYWVVNSIKVYQRHGRRG
ncbi:concanavalin A-like lectin/glucanase domain-containing protein [Pseudoneurospora amorphoporcata]|uniref:Concanavalin A-like lectin/glucanase domain-containing protein n=1 Tax=Pseudoneurospora amorphoporcata TaxID=241081 RepID=A0AAN6NWI0_9PEZI|nr:concanavalin A-like lectin/glucanase domain-containing protein [Pseudoneurospora amorphoporcata]